MKEQQIAHRIRSRLDAAAPPEDRILERLRMARETALGRQRVHAPVFALAGDAAEYFYRPLRHLSLWAQLAFAVLLLAAASAAINQWQIAQQADDIEEVDAAILTGDLPFNAYLDKGFDAWLNKTNNNQ
jgi:hypothetical protein